MWIVPSLDRENLLYLVGFGVWAVMVQAMQWRQDCFISPLYPMTQPQKGEEGKLYRLACRGLVTLGMWGHVGMEGVLRDSGSRVSLTVRGSLYD